MSIRVKGIDISRAQESFDVAKAKKSGVKFIILRAGIRTDKDSFFDRNLAECKKNNMPFGMYWYFEATDADTFHKELDACVSVVKDLRPSYPIFFDMEEVEQINKLTTKQRTDMLIEFCDTMTKVGLPSGLYTNISWMENYFDKSRIVGKIDIWLAAWTEDPNEDTTYDYGQTMWQWGVDKINGMNVDGDVCFINYPNKTSFWYSTHNVAINDSTDATKPSSSDVNKSTIHKGDKVTVNKGARFSNGVKPYDYVYNTTYDVLSISKSGLEACIGLGSQVTGWMYVKDLTVVNASAVNSSTSTSNKSDATIKVGDTVKVKANATTYEGRALAQFVYLNKYEVLQVGTKTYPDYVVIGQDGQITAAVKMKDLIKSN